MSSAAGRKAKRRCTTVLAELTPRETEVLRLLATGGLTNRELGKRLGIAPATVGTLWGSKTPITLVTCGFGRAGRQSDRCESLLEGPTELPCRQREWMRSQSDVLKSCAERAPHSVKEFPFTRHANRMPDTRFPGIQ
ncbi:MAG TPA: helix-turn-helix transcriptional regulator [Actinomycetota bacterium]|nr:helix-turn-helix transcriptional regulator [Actinomycetota bacterium]